VHILGPTYAHGHTKGSESGGDVGLPDHARQPLLQLMGLRDVRRALGIAVQVMGQHPDRVVLPQNSGRSSTVSLRNEAYGPGGAD